MCSVRNVFYKERYKMTKKVISAILALTMLFMTACGQADSSDDIKETTSITTVEQAQTEDTSSDSEPAGTTEETTTTTASETSEKEEKTSSQTERTEEKATTTTKTSEGNADTTTTTTPAATTTTKATTRATTYKPVQTTKATTRATTQATQKPVVTTTTKATTKPVTTTTKTTTAKPSSDIARQTKYLNSYDMYEIVTEYKSRHAICEKGIASMAAEINKIRKANGLNTLKVNPLLTKAAMIRARELAETYVKYGGISHTRPNGEYASSVIWEVGYYGNAFENAYYAFEWIDWKECLRVWLNSPDHKRNILDKGHEVMGLAIINVKIRNQYEGEGGGGRFTFAIQLFD